MRPTKIISVVGARPQFVKLAPLQMELKKHLDSFVVHTGQHYDETLSDKFFEELSIPKPEYNLGVGSATHGAQTGLMLKKLEEVFDYEKPDLVLVYGDTNSTLAGALAAAKMNIRVGHIEAGLRSFVKSMPEEINRVLTDRLSDILFCPTGTAVDNLKNEGIDRGVYLVGDLMYEALEIFAPIAERRTDILRNLSLGSREYILLTIHRAENTDNHNRLRYLMEQITKLGHKIVFPVHPRAKKELKSAGLWEHLQNRDNIVLTEPVGYFENIVLIKNAYLVLTDSGGIQKEAYYFGIPTITLRNETEWPETVASGINRLLADRELLELIASEEHPNGLRSRGIEPKTSEKIINVFLNY